MSKFISKTILTSQDGLEFTEIQRDHPIKLDEKKINFMTLQEQLLEQEKIENASKEEVTKVERKNASKLTIFDKTNPLAEEQCFKQEIFNEEDFDYFQYYGQLREMEDRNNKREKSEIQHFKQQRAKLVVDEQKQQIVLVKDQNREAQTKTSLNCIKIQVKRKNKEDEDQNSNEELEIIQKKVKLNNHQKDQPKKSNGLTQLLLGYSEDEDDD